MLAWLTCATGCSSIWHSFTEVTYEGEAEISREVIERKWSDPGDVRPALFHGTTGVMVQLTATRTGTVRERVEFGRVTVHACVRNGSGGAGGNPLYAVLETLGGGSGGSPEGAVVLIGLILLAAIAGAGLLACDALFFVPWWIGGHAWIVDCDYRSRDAVVTRVEFEERSVSEETRPENRPVEFRIGGNVVGSGSIDGNSRVRLTYADLIRLSRGRTGPLELQPPGDDVRFTADLADLLAGASGRVQDWSVDGEGPPPDLAAELQQESNVIRIRVTNRGKGDACQVACLVAGAGGGSDGRCATIGRLRAGETLAVEIRLGEAPTGGRVEFSESRDRGPAPLAFGVR
jgi:hypothetical protein